VTPTANTCPGIPQSFTITVFPTPTVNTITDVPYCNGASAVAIDFTSPAGNGTVSYAWTSSVDIGFGLSGSGDIGAFTATNTGSSNVTAIIKATPSSNGCDGVETTVTSITVYPTPTVITITDATYCNGDAGTALDFTSPAGNGTVTYTWTSSVDIGFGTSGNGDIAGFTATNLTSSPVTAIVKAIPTSNGCAGAETTVTSITVNPTPTVNTIANAIYCNGDPGAAIDFTSPAGNGTVTYTWTSSVDIGFGTSGNGDIAAYTATNNTSSALVAIVKAIPTASTCVGAETVVTTITVNPPPTPTVAGPTSACAFSTGHVYSTALLTGHAYLWTVTGGNITLGQGTSSITVTWGAGGSGIVQVQEFISATTCSAISTLGVTVKDLPAPVVTGPATVIVNTSAVYSTNNVAGYAYSWSVTGAISFTGQGTSSINVHWANTPGTGTVSVTALDITTGCVGSSAPYIVTITPAGVQVNGYFKYLNTGQTPLDGLTLNLKLAGITKATTTTNLSGYYEFNGVLPGTYTIEASTTKPEGGVNTTDAGQVNNWGVSPTSIERVKYNAGDVNLTDGVLINASDAGFIAGHFVNGTPFAGGVWTFWHQGDQSAANPPSGVDTFVVGSSNVVRNYWGRCLGDFNGNYIPAAGTKGGSQVTSLQLAYNGTRQVGAGEVFQLPVEVVNNIQIGAVSLILNFPSDLVSVENVYLLDGNTGGEYDVLLFNVTGNELRIGWSSQNPLVLNTNDALLTIEMKTSPYFTIGQTIQLSLTADPLNELADGLMEPITDAVLNTYTVEFSTTGLGENDPRNGITLRNYPNPFEDFTYLEYTLPTEGVVTVEITNMLGARVALLENGIQGSGKHLVKVDGVTLTPGVYTATLKLNAKGDVMIRTIKLVRGTK
jgi:hypothetical protein